MKKYTHAEIVHIISFGSEKEWRGNKLNTLLNGVQRVTDCTLPERNEFNEKKRIVHLSTQCVSLKDGNRGKKKSFAILVLQFICASCSIRIVLRFHIIFGQFFLFPSQNVCVPLFSSVSFHCRVFVHSFRLSFFTETWNSILHTDRHTLFAVDVRQSLF